MDLNTDLNLTIHPSKNGALQREVAIIGVGHTPWMLTHKTEDWAGITEPELFAIAALDAMDDAGLTGKDIDAFTYAQLFNATSDTINANVAVQNWIGMRGKESFHVESACTSPGAAFEAAVDMVASGKHDVVLAGGVDIAQSRPVNNNPACFREPQAAADLNAVAGIRWQDNAYTRFQSDEGRVMMEGYAYSYMKKYGLTPKDIDDAFIGLNISDSRSAAACGEGITKKSYVELAEEAGKDVWDYMRVPTNPQIANFVRASGTSKYADGAAAVIVTTVEKAREWAEKTGRPAILVRGTAYCNLDHIHPWNLEEMNKECWRALQERTGVTSEDIDAVQSPSYMCPENFSFVSQIGYIPEEKVYEYYRDGRTAFDGDKPMNTCGGTQGYGHCYGAGGLMMIDEAVRQFRGEAGAHQMKKLPYVQIVRSQGGAQGTNMILLETLDHKANTNPKPRVTPKPRRFVKAYYDGLEEGKLLGAKCPKCGNVEFFPYYSCSECGDHELELVELSGDAVIEGFVTTRAATAPLIGELGPYVVGNIKLVEGPRVNALILGITPDNADEAYEKLPIPCKVKIIQLKDANYKRIVWEAQL